MAVPQQVITSAVKAFLKSPEGKKIITSAITSVAKSTLTGASDEQNDYTDNKENNNSNNDIENMSQSQKLDKIREIMVGSPSDYIVRGAASAGAGLTDFIGNKSVTDANNLASAILAANRTNSARQNEIYGPSKKENAANVWANEKLRRGENVKNATNEISKVIRDLSDVYKQREDATRAMQAQEILGAPGNFYNYLNSIQRANAASTNSKKNKGGK